MNTAELIARAQRELDTNPTITAYLWIDGRELRYHPRWGIINNVLDVVQHVIDAVTGMLADILGLSSGFLDELTAVFAPLTEQP